MNAQRSTNQPTPSDAKTSSEQRRALMAVLGINLRIALVANWVCVKLLPPHRDGGIHMTATWIFTTVDALANLGVIAAGALVLVTKSSFPDLVVGTAIGLIVLRGAFRILSLRVSDPL